MKTESFESAARMTVSPSALPRSVPVGNDGISVRGLRVEALKLAGDRLAAVLPAFKPYADKMKFEAKCDTSADDAEAPADDAAAAEPTVSV